MLLFKEIDGLLATDKVCEKEGHHVKIRILKEEHGYSSKKSGPGSISFKITASICDEKGKSLPRPDGRYHIIPHSVTIPLLEISGGDYDLEVGLNKTIESLIQKTVNWYKVLEKTDYFYEEWTKQPPASSQT